MSCRKTIGIIFSNTHDEMLKPLTDNRAIASVSFGGRYRLIDFILTNMVSSGIYEIGVITKQNYYSLMEHLGSGNEWDLDRKQGGLHIIPPHSHDDYGYYNGRIQALGNALDLLEHSSANYVIMADCDRVFNADLTPLYEYHISKGADITMAYKTEIVDTKEAKDSSFISVDEEGRVLDILIHPAIVGSFNRNINVMMMERTFLIGLVKNLLAKGVSDFTGVLQAHVKDMKIYGYNVETEVMTIGSIKQYYQANMSLLNSDIRHSIFPAGRPIYTRVRDEVPARYGLDSNVKNSLVADGCIIEGDVENCILSRGVIVKPGAKLKNSIIMNGCVIGYKGNINYAVIDRNTEIKDYRVLNGTSEYPVFIPKNQKV